MFLGVFSSEDLQEASFKSRTGQIFFPLCANLITRCTWRSVEGLPQTCEQPLALFLAQAMSSLPGRPGRRYNMGNAGADFSSLEYFFQQCAWPCWLTELSLCRHAEVGNIADIISVFPCENKSLVTVAKCHIPQGTCWFYEVGLSNWKVDWVTDWLPDLQGWIRKRPLHLTCDVC